MFEYFNNIFSGFWEFNSLLKKWTVILTMVFSVVYVNQQGWQELMRKARRCTAWLDVSALNTSTRKTQHLWRSSAHVTWRMVSRVLRPDFWKLCFVNDEGLIYKRWFCIYDTFYTTNLYQFLYRFFRWYKTQNTLSNKLNREALTLRSTLHLLPLYKKILH